MKRRAVLALAVAAGLLAGCASREFYLSEPEAPWEAKGIATVEVPMFEAQPSAWAVGADARGTIIDALARGTVRIVDHGGQGVLEGAVVTYDETTTTGAPRRVQQSSSASGLSGVSYVWELDATYTVRVGFVMRLKDAKGELLWTKETFGDGTETSTVRLNWPGGDPVPPPSVLPTSPDRSVFLRLRQEAINEALSPMISALTVHYGYKTLR
jgi:hypothetical protein